MMWRTLWGAPKRKKLLKSVSLFGNTINLKSKFFLDDFKKFHLMILKNIVLILMKCGKFGKTFISAVEKHAPLPNITLKGNNLSYITTDIRMMIRQRDYLRGKANKTGRDILRQAFHQIRNKVTYAIRKARSEYFTKKLTESNGDLKQTWQTLKQTCYEQEGQV